MANASHNHGLDPKKLVIGTQATSQSIDENLLTQKDSTYNPKP